MLQLRHEAYVEMVALAYDRLPDEACGLLGGRPGSDTGEVFYPCGNAAASSRVYTIEPRDHLRADRDAEGRGLELIGVMHSHTHTEAYPSPTDVAQAPDPTWHYVIVSLRQDAPVLRSYRIRDGIITEEPVTVLDRSRAVSAHHDLDDDAPSAGFDVTDPDFLADPYPVLAALREATPVFAHADRWFVTRFADVHALLRHPCLGRVRDARPNADPAWPAFHAVERWSLLELEPPDHTRLRTLVAKVFTARAVAALRPSIVALADEVLDAASDPGGALPTGRPTDLLAEVAQPYSIGVICSLLGLPRADGSALLAWSHAMVKMYELAVTPADQEEADPAAADFDAYVRARIAERRAQPDGGLLSQLAHGGLADEEIVSTTILLLNAGHEASVNTLGNGMWALLSHRDEWRRVTAGEVEARVVVEEMLRFDPPLQLFERWVLGDGVEVGGRAMVVGDRVALLFGSANRDPRRFHDAERFVAGRGDTTHIGFGGGTHYCPGAPLARLELEVMVGALARRFGDLVAAEPPRRHPAFVIRGFEALLVRLRP